MVSIKRKAPSTGPGSIGQSLLQRRVRPRIEPEPESESDAPSEEGVGSDGSETSDAESGSDDGSEEEEGEEDDESASDSEAESEDGPIPGAAQLSFGALARAQASMTSSSSSSKKSGKAASAKDELGEAETRREPDWGPERARLEREKRDKMAKRANKHAPVEVSSKKPVSRRREFIEVPKREARDPRFGPLGPMNTTVDDIKARNAYAFLDEYQADEMNQLRAAIKKAKDGPAKDELQRALMSMESRKKAKDRKDRERALIEEHRRQEKELVKQGKTPFYLKKSEQKKRLLIDQFASMKKGQIDHAIERKRKKVDSKEKKNMPWARRGVE
ncbi:hypothetical protein B0T19DRAFT_400702 [Cercophora scortea]|uniref:rRNA biogenesis protein RRP36 n=1 Tax=Cercophora scortea TaxID=314031 RepID=A0AAE0IMI2_9PEZI|nr:hypothetical protein B0T19DRAFT_400702 [Cercophora scortea]